MTSRFEEPEDRPGATPKARPARSASIPGDPFPWAPDPTRDLPTRVNRVPIDPPPDAPPEEELFPPELGEGD